MAKKGAVLVFEQVMLFMIGVAIFISLFAVFSTYQTHFNRISAQDQLSEVNNIISSRILIMSQEDKNTNISVSLSIPRTVGGMDYKIELFEDGLNVSTIDKGIFSFSSLYNLNSSFYLAGRVLSTSGRLVIYKNGNRIIII